MKNQNEAFETRTRKSDPNLSYINKMRHFKSKQGEMNQINHENSKRGITNQNSSTE